MCLLWRTPPSSRRKRSALIYNTVTLSLWKCCMCLYILTWFFLVCRPSQHRWAVLQNSFPLQGRCPVPSNPSGSSHCPTTTFDKPRTTISHHHNVQSLQQCGRQMWKDTAHKIQLSTKDHFCGYGLCSIQAWPGVSGCGRVVVVNTWKNNGCNSLLMAIEIIKHKQCAFNVAEVATRLANSNHKYTNALQCITVKVIITYFCESLAATCRFCICGRMLPKRLRAIS